MTVGYPVVDETGKSWAGTPTSTDNFRFGDGAMRGSITAKITTADTGDFYMSTQNWTYEWWHYFTSTLGTPTGITIPSDPVYSESYFQLGCRPVGKTYIDYENPSIPLAMFYVECDTPSFTLNTWHHIVFERDGNVGHCFFDGVLLAPTYENYTTLDFKPPEENVQLYTVPRNGAWLDEFRYSLGIARYPTGGFTPPTNPFTVDAYTKSLIHFDYQYVPPPTGLGQVILWKRKGV